MHRPSRVMACLLLGLSCLLGPAPLVAGEAKPARVEAKRDLFPTDAWDSVAARRAILIDVRLPSERATGSPRGVQAEVPYALDGHADDAFVSAISQEVRADRAAPLILICAAGPRSDAARNLLQARGFTNVSTVINGFQGWRDFDLPRAR